jgi:hypothetical protein
MLAAQWSSLLTRLRSAVLCLGQEVAGVKADCGCVQLASKRPTDLYKVLPRVCCALCWNMAAPRVLGSEGRRGGECILTAVPGSYGSTAASAVL